jgi:hypothetical protein
MTIGSGIAVAGIWLGVGICAPTLGGFTAFVAVFALFATGVVASMER